MGELFGIKGYNYSPLEERKVVEFVSRVGDVQRKQKMDFEKLQVCKGLNPDCMLFSTIL